MELILLDVPSFVLFCFLNLFITMMIIRLNNHSLITDKKVQNFYDLQTSVVPIPSYLFWAESMWLAFFYHYISLNQHFHGIIHNGSEIFVPSDNS